MISPELATFLESGVSVLVGTRDTHLVPDATRALGARVEAAGRELTVFLSGVFAAAALANVRDNGRIAVCFSRPADHRSFQVKGAVLSIAEAVDSDRGLLERYNELIAAAWGEMGIAPALTRRLIRWPCWAVRLRVESVYVQTPGPGAGSPLGGTAVPG